MKIRAKANRCWKCPVCGHVMALDARGCEMVFGGKPHCPKCYAAWIIANVPVMEEAKLVEKLA